MDNQNAPAGQKPTPPANPPMAQSIPLDYETRMLSETTKQSSHLRRIADALERLVDLAMEEREASASGDERPVTDLAGRPLR